MKKLALSLLMVLFVLSFAVANGQNDAGAAAPAAAPAVNVDDVVASYFSNMPGHIYKIGQADFVEKVKAGDAMTIIDIRSAADYAAGHIKGAVNLPWGTMEIAENMNKIPQSGEVFVYCVSGQTAGQTVMLMNAAGIPARSVNLGYKFGISKVDGVGAVTTTEASTLDSASYNVDPALAAEISAYYKGIMDLKGDTFASYKVSEDNAKKILDAGDDSVLFVSIRKADDYAKGHIAGAVNIPFGKDMYSMFASLPADKKLIVYCYTGQTAGQTVAALRLLGYDAVSMNGGMGMPANAPLGWSAKGYPVVK